MPSDSTFYWERLTVTLLPIPKCSVLLLMYSSTASALPNTVSVDQSLGLIANDTLGNATWLVTNQTKH